MFLIQKTTPIFQDKKQWVHSKLQLGPEGLTKTDVNGRNFFIILLPPQLFLQHKLKKIRSVFETSNFISFFAVIFNR